MKKQPSSRTCFLCGRENSRSLKVSWYSDREEAQAVAEVIIPEEYNSYPGFVHGGIVAALLDETAGRALMVDGNHDKLMVTATLEVKYRQPVPTNTPLLLRGWVLKPGDQRARVAAEIYRPDGNVLASCTATVLKPPQHYYDLWNWEKEQEYWRVYDD